MIIWNYCNMVSFKVSLLYHHYTSFKKKTRYVIVYCFNAHCISWFHLLCSFCATVWATLTWVSSWCDMAWNSDTLALCWHATHTPCPEVAMHWIGFLASGLPVKLTWKMMQGNLHLYEYICQAPECFFHNYIIIITTILQPGDNQWNIQYRYIRKCDKNKIMMYIMFQKWLFKY
jgi:hypothetical protein